MKDAKIVKPKQEENFRIVSQDPRIFESPLAKWIRENCVKCSIPCDIYKPETLDRMFLCMTAATIQATTDDPLQSIQDAKDMLSSIFNPEGKQE